MPFNTVIVAFYNRQNTSLELVAIFNAPKQFSAPDTREERDVECIHAHSHAPTKRHLKPVSRSLQVKETIRKNNTFQWMYIAIVGRSVFSVAVKKKIEDYPKIFL